MKLFVSIKLFNMLLNYIKVKIYTYSNTIKNIYFLYFQIKVAEHKYKKTRPNTIFPT